MKKFFTVVPLQGKGNLEQYHYQPVENERLAMEEKTAFPIVPVMNGYLQPGEESQVIAVVIENEDTNRNYQQFMEEVDALCARKGLVHPEIKKVVVPMDDSVNAHIDLFQKLIEYTEENDELFACITYGTKPLSMAVRMAVQYAYRVMRNTTIDCIVYGQIDRSAGSDRTLWTGKVYDETGLVRLDEIVRLMADQKVANPKGILRDILAL